MDRRRTAIRRYRCSRPVALALADGLINQSTTVFDCGCGYGEDLRYLRSRGIAAVGWDPYHRPEEQIEPADVVNLGYVLNVIEDHLAEREHTLCRAYELARQVLVVAVRVDRTLERGTEYGDGQVTSVWTFQKIYSQSEFRHYVESTIGRRTHVAALGVVYVFKEEGPEARYLASRAFTRRLEYRTDLLHQFSGSPIARRYVRLATELGRIPLPEEFEEYPKLLESFGSPQRLERLTLRHIDQSAFEGSRAQRREDILTYLAMLRLQGLRPPPLGALPGSIRTDIRAIWPTYAAAHVDAEAFLFSMGRPEAVRAACASSPFGKLVATDLYFHRSVEDDLPPLLRLLAFAAREIVGDVAYDIIKISGDGQAVSFLAYPHFDQDPHPALSHSVRVYLPRASYEIRDYSGYENPPILHRKDALVGPSYPHFEKFRRLTEAEQSLGLLSMPEIGRRTTWQNLLAARRVAIEHHMIRHLQ